MTKEMKYWILILILPFLAVSCMDMAFPEIRTEEDCGIRIALRLSCELLDTEELTSRSRHDISTLRKISNANYYLFQDGKLVGQGYCADAEDFTLILPSADEQYNLYVLANLGEKPVNQAISEEEMRTEVYHDYGDYENYFSTIEENGFPMSAVVKGFTAEVTDDILLRRLVHTVYVSVNTDALSTTKMNITGISIKNAARDIYPFSSASKARFVMDGDAADPDADELAVVNGGGKLALHLLENMRGELFPGNADWKRRIPGNMVLGSEAGLCSYVEFTAQLQTATAFYGRNFYRAYLGESAADCNVRRHTYFELCSRFVNDAIVDEEWRAEADVPDINETLAFVDTRYTKDTAPSRYAEGDVSDRPFKHVDAFYTMKGCIALYYIYRSNPDIGYTLTMEPCNSDSADCDRYIQYETRDVDDNFTALVVRTTYPISDGLTRYYSSPSYTSGKSVSFKICSSDGLITDRLYCKVIEHPLSMTFKYEGLSSSQTDIGSNHQGQFNMYLVNPLGAYVAVHNKGTVYGECRHHPNGLVGSEKTETYEVEINTGNRHKAGESVPYAEAGSNAVFDVIPKERLACRIDLYKPQMRTGAGVFYKDIDGFHEFFMDIWNNTAWDDNTWFGTSGHNKHAEPTRLKLDMDIMFLSPNLNRLLPLEDFPVFIENYVSGVDMGFKFHQTNVSGFTKTVEFNNADMISVSINGVRDWRSNKVFLKNRSTFGNDYDSIVKQMINHSIDMQRYTNQ